MGVHDGRRARVRARVAREGVVSMEPHEVLEWLLFYAIPVRDVNGLAHELVSHFGGLAGVLDAGAAALAARPGVGVRTAAYLETLGACVRAYGAVPAVGGARLRNLASSIRYMSDAKVARDGDYLLCLDSDSCLLSAGRMESFDAKPSELRALVEQAIRCNAYSVVAVSRDMTKDARFTSADRDFAGLFRRVMGSLNVQTLDFVRIGRDGYASIRQENENYALPLALNEPPRQDDGWLSDIPEAPGEDGR